MTANLHLKIAMAEHGLSQVELAETVNMRLREAGERDSVGTRTVRTWVTGKSTWPRRAKREALAAVFRCPIRRLGFYPPGALPPPQEDPEVIRRSFMTGAGATAAAVASPLPARAASPRQPRRVGASDVLRLRERVEQLVARDAAHGGHTDLARDALAGASEALSLQNQPTTQRVRQRLFALASDFTATAAWSLIDAGELDAAGRHLDRALTLAGMARDSDMTMQVWNFRAMLARQRKDYTEAVAAAQAAQASNIVRRSPLHASLAHARTAVGFAHCGDRRAALRSLGRAEDALARADLNAPRAEWMNFYGPGELNALTSIVHDRIGSSTQAEAASYRALRAIPKQYRRNRAMATARLALAQLHQSEVEQGCATTADVFSLIAGNPMPGRLRILLGNFHRDLLTIAPTTTAAREWADRYRSEWSNA